MARHQWKSSVLKLMSLAPIAASVWLSLPAPAQAAQYNYCWRYPQPPYGPIEWPTYSNANDEKSADAQNEKQLALQNAIAVSAGYPPLWSSTKGPC